MADVRVNDQRVPPLQSIDDLSILIQKLEFLAEKKRSALTSLSVNGSSIDMDNMHYHKLKLDLEDMVEARIDTPQQLSFESLQVAQDMAELLLTDLKLAAVHLWNERKHFEKKLETLLNDCSLFLTLAGKPIYLLNKKIDELDVEAQNCLKELDKIANHLENSILLAVNGKTKNACYVLVGMVKTSIEKWLGFSVLFAQILNINNPFIE